MPDREHVNENQHSDVRSAAAFRPMPEYTEVQVPLLSRTMECDGAPILCFRC
jgi:hypothetical protein